MSNRELQVQSKQNLNCAMHSNQRSHTLLYLKNSIRITICSKAIWRTHLSDIEGLNQSNASLKETYEKRTLSLQKVIQGKSKLLTELTTRYCESNKYHGHGTSSHQQEMQWRRRNASSFAMLLQSINGGKNKATFFIRSEPRRNKENHPNDTGVRGGNGTACRMINNRGNNKAWRIY